MNQDDEKFDKPLDTWIDEEVLVKKVKMDPDTNKLNITNQIEHIRTKYFKVPFKKHRCKTGEHFFKILDPHRGIFSCTKCPYSRQVFPTTYKFEKGRLIHRVTGQVV